jgi:hypothetical protein
VTQKTDSVTGATFPSLHPEDFGNLGIDSRYYAAQSVQTMTTANGAATMFCYELHVTIPEQSPPHLSLVDDNDAVWPFHGKYIGGLSPVCLAHGTDLEGADENGWKLNLRLSGMIPFLAGYVACTPTRNRMFIGEDRNGKSKSVPCCLQPLTHRCRRVGLS